MAGKRAASSEKNHPVVKKIRSSRAVSESPRKLGRPKSAASDFAPTPKYKTGAGVLLTCGQGEVGQLGLGPDIMERKAFALVPNLNNVIEIAVGGMHTVCLTEDGKVYTWGCNDEGALGREADEDGQTEPGPVSLPKKAVQISAGDSHSAALIEDGTVFVWGAFRDSHGSMGLRGEGIQKVPFQVERVSGVVKISSGADHFVMLTSRGTVLTAGCPEQGQLGRVTKRSASRDARRGMMCLEPGEVYVKRKPMDNVFTGVYSTFLTSKDSILGFGLNNYSQLGEAEPESSSEDASTTSTCFFTPHSIKSLSEQKWSMLATGQHHSLALDTGGKMYSFGRHEYGRLGLKDAKEPVTVPTLIPALQDKTIKFIACGNCVSFAIDSEGNLYGWGMGNGYQLGNAKEDDILEPMKIEGKQLSNYTVLQVAAGGQHSVVLAKPK